MSTSATRRRWTGSRRLSVVDVLYGVEPGHPQPLGATVDATGVNFSLFTRHATGVQLLLFDEHDHLNPVEVLTLDPEVNKSFYFWHSPDDVICPFTEAENANKALSKLGASTVLRTYKGGHGWVPFTLYGDRIKEAIEWMRLPAEKAEALRAKITEAK